MTVRRGRRFSAAATAALLLASGEAHGNDVPGDAPLDQGTSGTAGQAIRAPSTPPATPLFKPEEELILEVRTDRYIITDAMSGYASPRGAYLPLGEFTRLLDLAVAVDADAARAEGWFLAEDRTFRLDIPGRFVETPKGRKELQEGDAIAFEGEIYVRAPLLAEWFPVEVETSLSQQQVKLKLLEKFPFEARIERANSRGSLGASRSTAVQYERGETPYAFFSLPALDVNLRGTTGTRTDTTGQFDIRASNDFLFMNADLFVAGDHRDPLSSARFVLRRRDPDGDLLGPLGLTLIEVGDTASAPLPVGLRSRTGRGFVVGNVPLDRSSVFDRIDLRGELPLGYEVELYRNDVLIASVDRPVDGRYEFLQVPLEFGLNILRLVFYGPRGERREEVRRINAGQGRLGSGEFNFTASAVEQDSLLLGIEPDREGGRTEQPGRGDIRASAYAEYGLSSAVTVAAGLASFTTGGERRNQGLLGLRTGIGAAAVQVDAALQNKGAWALQLGAAGRAFGASYVLQHAEYGSGFVDETRASGSDEFRRATQARIDTSLRLGKRVIAANLLAERAESEGRVEYTAGLRTSTALGRWLVSNRLEFRQSDSADNGSSRNLAGGIEANGVIAGWGTRAGISYEIDPSFDLRDFNLTFDREVGNELLLRVGITQQLSQNYDTRAAISIAKRFRIFDLAADVQYDTGSGGFLLGFRIGFSVGYDRRRGLALAAPGLARGGSLLAVAFRDLNGNGVRDPGEMPVEGLGFRGGVHEAKTDQAGEALIIGLGDGRPAQVSIISETIEDPYLFPKRGGVEIVPRPGRTHVATFPIVAVSEVEGTAVFETEAGERAVSNVELELVNEAGTAIATARTEYDGFFLFERVPAGAYRVRLNPEQAQRLKVRLVGEPDVEASADGGVVDKLRVTLTKDITADAGRELK